SAPRPSTPLFRSDPPAATRSADQGSRSTSVFPASDVDSAAQPPSATVQDDDPPVSRTGAAASALAGLSVAVPLVTADARPRHPSSHSTLPPAVLDADASSSSPSAREPLRAEQVPPFTAQSAWAAVTDRRGWASASTTDASVLVRAEPVQPVSQPVSASASTSPSSLTSTRLDVPQPLADAQSAAPLPATCRSVVRSAEARRTVSSAASSASDRSRSRPEPLESLWQVPPPDSHSALALSGVARLDCPQSPPPSHHADARVCVPFAPRLDALLRQPESSHEASAFEPPDSDDAPQPDETPDRHSRRCESRFPSADSLTDPQAVNAPSESQPAAEPSASRSSSETVRTSRSVASIRSSVAS